MIIEASTARRLAIAGGGLVIVTYMHVRDLRIHDAKILEGIVARELQHQRTHRDHTVAASPSEVDFVCRFYRLLQTDWPEGVQLREYRKDVVSVWTQKVEAWALLFEQRALYEEPWHPYIEHVEHIVAHQAGTTRSLRRLEKKRPSPFAGL